MATVAAGLALLLVGWLTVFGPFLSAPAEDLVSTPGLAGLVVRQEVPLPSGSRACTQPVTLAEPADRVRFLAAGSLWKADGLSVTVTGLGFKASGREPQLAQAGPDTFLTIPFSAAVTGAAVRFRICLRNDGPQIRLVGTDEGNSTAEAATTVDGRPTTSDISISVLGARQLTRWDALRQAPERISRATGVPSGPVISALALLVLLALVAIPLAALVAADWLRQDT